MLFLAILFFAVFAYGQQQRVAIIQTLDDRDSVGFSDLNYLTVRFRETAVNVLPELRYIVMSMQSIVDFLGSQERAVKACKEASCLAELGRKVSADYVAQARIGRFGKDFTISVELYKSNNSALVGSFTSNSKDIYGLTDIIDEKAPVLFKKMPGAGDSKIGSPSVVGGISGVQKAMAYEVDEEKLYLVNLNTEPPGAALSFDGVPSCLKTPCKVELHGGNVRIIAALDQYERADTTVFIKQNNQSISIMLKYNFGVLEVKPAYLNGIGQNTQWTLSINDNLYPLLYPLGEIRLSPNKYAVKLNHECYENIGFDVGINKGKREVFDMAGNITLKKGGLILSAERNGEPVSESVFLNDSLYVGETPFSGAIPLCAKVKIGKNREVVDVKLKYNEKIKHTHHFNANRSSGWNSFTDSRDGNKYRTVVIGNQTWMAENMNYNAIGSKCYDNLVSNCQKYGRLYNWSTAKVACPSGWHLPSDAEWTKLTNFVGTKAGTKLKAANGWGKKVMGIANGQDTYGFSALPGGYGYYVGRFRYIGDKGYWWTSSEKGNEVAYYRYMNMEYVYEKYDNKFKHLFSVRCLQD